MRRTAVVVALLVLGVGPWLSILPTGLFASPASAFDGPLPAPITLGGTFERPLALAAPPTRAAAGCTCREIVITARNVVRDAEVRTGDAEVVNKSITYVAPTYGDEDVEVDQEAEAHSGDAVAGQILSIAGGQGCSNINVTATNIVEDAEVRSGDATARNESVILLAPGVREGDLDIDVDQEAEATTGDAIAGQIIGVTGGGPCGDVILNALNEVRDVDVRSGEAKTKNKSEIVSCADVRCLKEFRELLQDVDSVNVCEEEECHSVKPKQFVGMLKDSLAEAEDHSSDEDVFDDDDDSVSDKRARKQRRHRTDPLHPTVPESTEDEQLDDEDDAPETDPQPASESEPAVESEPALA